MKKIIYAILILTGILSAAVVCAALPFEGDLNILYVSDRGKGDGSSAASPLGNLPGYDGEGKEAYKNSALWRAFDILSQRQLNGTGAKIVVCGTLTLNNGHEGNAPEDRSSDMNLPSLPAGYTVTITSVDPFDETDYRVKRTAMIVMDRTVCGVNLQTNADVLFENLTILSKFDTSSPVGVMRYAGSICANCKRLTIGDGVLCLGIDKASGTYLPETAENAFAFPKLIGSNRYANRTGDTRLTVNSGTWCGVNGADLGIGYPNYGLLTGNTNIVINGGTVLSGICGTGTGSESRITGNVSITLNGGAFYAPVKGCGPKGFLSGSTCRISVNGGDFSAISGTIFFASDGESAEAPSYAEISFQGYGKDDLASLMNSTDGFDKVYGRGEENVIFIRDGGTGDGSSSSSPLSAEPGVSALSDISGTPPTYMDTALWQAFWKLRETGGTVVICGEIDLHANIVEGTASSSRNFDLPSHGKNLIRVTSVWKGVDYRNAGARLIIETPTQLVLDGETEWDDVNIVTKGTGRIISCNGHRTVFGAGVACSVYDPANASNAGYYPTVVGGNRFKILETDTDLTILGGTWDMICAGSYSINITNTSRDMPYGTLTGDAHLTFGGNAVCKRGIFGTTNNNGTPDAATTAYHTGNVFITVTGGNVTTIYGAGNGRFGNKNATVYLKVTGIADSVSSCSTKVSTGSLNFAPSYAVLDLSEFTGNPDVFITGSGFTNIVPPTGRLVSCGVSTAPERKIYAQGEMIDFTGMLVRARYRSGAAASSQKIASFLYSPLIDGFSLVSLPANGATSVTAAYQGLSMPAISIVVTDKTAPSVLGAQTKTSNALSQGLRFIAKIDRQDAENVESYGFMILPEKALPFLEELRFGPVGGAKVIDATGTELAETAYGEIDREEWLLFSGDTDAIDVEHYGTDYAAVAFIKYIYNGTEVISYSEPVTRSVYGVSLAAASSEKESGQTKSWLKTNVVSRAARGAGNPVSEGKSMELRSSIVSYMQTMSEVAWKTAEDIDYRGTLSYSTPLYSKDTLYYGLPYNSSYGNATAFASLLVNGILPKGTDTGWYRLPGNTCSTSIIIAMNYSVNTISEDVGATNMIPVYHNGYKAVGDTVQPEWITTTRRVIEGYGETDGERESVLYESYAKMQPADILVMRWFSASNNCLGHSLQVAGFPTVARDPDGSIDPDASTVLIIEQTSSIVYSGDLNSKPSNWRKRVLTFKAMRNENLIPVTVDTFASGYTESPFCVLRGFSTAATAADGLEGRINSNYHLEWVSVTLEKNGSVIAEDKIFPVMSNTEVLENNTPNVDAALAASSGEMTVRVTARVKSGEREIGLLTFTKS